MSESGPENQLTDGRRVGIEVAQEELFSTTFFRPSNTVVEFFVFGLSSFETVAPMKYWRFNVGSVNAFQPALGVALTPTEARAVAADLRRPPRSDATEGPCRGTMREWQDPSVSVGAFRPGLQ